MSIALGADSLVASQSGRPEMMPWITPYLTVRDVATALDFYEAAFGFERQAVHQGPDGTIMHARISWQDGSIMMGPEGAYGGTSQAPITSGVESPTTIYVYCGDVDALARQAESIGATLVFAPMDMFWGDRCCKLVDPEGYAWNFATFTGCPPSRRDPRGSVATGITEPSRRWPLGRR